MSEPTLFIVKQMYLLALFKQKLENDLSQGLNDKLSQWNNVIPSNVLGQVQEGANQTIHDGINRFPDYANLTIEDQVVRPSISVVMPLYTGGLTSSAKKNSKYTSTAL